jgi:hypothetical protein
MKKKSALRSYKQIPCSDVLIESCANMSSPQKYEVGASQEASQDMYIIGREAFHGDEKVIMAEAVEYALDFQEVVPDEVIKQKEKCTLQL